MENKPDLRKWARTLNIRTKLILIFLSTSIVVFFLDIYIYVNINQMIANIDSVYESNADLSELQQLLNDVQVNLEEYLSTKSSDSMERYFTSEQDFRNAAMNLNQNVVDNETLLMEKNISNMSQEYLSLTSQTVEAKRSRNISKYKLLFAQSEEMYSYIDTYIYGLNNQQYQNNTTNYKVLLSTLTYSEMITMGILLAVGALNVLLILMLVRDITKPLKELSYAAGEVAEGNLNIRMKETENKDEVGVVSRAFNKMVESLNLHMIQLKESMEKESALKEKDLLMQAHLKDAQLKYLQAQINPHFLFNTLNAGAQLAMMEEADHTYEYVQKVADFYRYNLKNAHTVVTLKEEIQMVDYYMYIINVRFSNEIEYIKQIDEELLNLKIPGMILQPVVENSMKYGIRDIDWEGRICISAEKEGDDAVIQIYDNGKGISEETIKKIMNRQLEQKDMGEGSGGVGLDNVISRLQLYFEREDVMEIISRGKDGGTTTVFRLPLREKES